MRFQVPQFTDVEDKIFGPLTFKQFVYLAGSGGLCVIIYFLIPIGFVAFALMLPVAAFGAALAFYKVNGKSFINMVEAFLKYSIAGKLYIWKQIEKKPVVGSAPKELSSSFLPKLSGSKLKDMTWNLGVTESINPVTRNDLN